MGEFFKESSCRWSVYQVSNQALGVKAEKVQLCSRSLGSHRSGCTAQSSSLERYKLQACNNMAGARDVPLPGVLDSVQPAVIDGAGTIRVHSCDAALERRCH